MGQPTPSPAPRDPWRDLVPAMGDAQGERRFLEQALALVASSVRGAAALYLRRDQGFSREMRVGSGPFPATVADAGELDALRLPGALLALRRGGAGLEPDGVGVAAVAAGVRLLELRRHLKQQRFAVSYRGVELEALYDVGLAIASTLNLEELAEEILLRAVMLLDARRAALYLLDGERYRLHSTFGGAARLEVRCDAAEVRSLLEPDLESLPDGDGELLPGARHLLAVPIEVEARPRGLLVVGDKENRQGVGPFGASDRRTLELFANQAAIALENARLHRQALEKERLEREMELAAAIQRQLLPSQVPLAAGYEILGWSRPAQHVGGDYYDLLPLAGGKVGLVVGDVSGKGMPAALMVSTVHSALRLLVDRVPIGPELVLELSRHILETSAPNKFITFAIAELDPPRRHLQYVSAGHNPAVLLRSAGELLCLEAGGRPLGLLAGGSYSALDLQLEPGDLLCLYSDGVTECFAPDDEEFGLERLVDVLREHRTDPLQAIVEAVDRATGAFADGLPQGDDQTLLLLRVGHVDRSGAAPPTGA